jgi:hypothetical protein
MDSVRDSDGSAEVSRGHSVCLAAHASGGLKSHLTRGPGSISKGGGNASLAEAADSFGGQGVHREVGSEGLEENHRVVIDGSYPEGEPVGQRWAMVKPALWRRRRLGSSPSYQGVCGRHGGEETCVTQGGLVSSERKVWLRYGDTRRRKGGKRGAQTSTWSHREVGVDISGSEIPADAVPGIGSGNSTQERGQRKGLGSLPGSSGAGVSKRYVRGGSPRTLLSVGSAWKW